MKRKMYKLFFRLLIFGYFVAILAALVHTKIEKVVDFSKVFRDSKVVAVEIFRDDDIYIVKTRKAGLKWPTTNLFNSIENVNYYLQR